MDNELLLNVEIMLVVCLWCACFFFVHLGCECVTGLICLIF